MALVKHHLAARADAGNWFGSGSIDCCICGARESANKRTHHAVKVRIALREPVRQLGDSGCVGVGLLVLFAPASDQRRIRAEDHAGLESLLEWLPTLAAVRAAGLRLAC